MPKKNDDKHDDICTLQQSLSSMVICVLVCLLCLHVHITRKKKIKYQAFKMINQENKLTNILSISVDNSFGLMPRQCQCGCC